MAAVETFQTQIAANKRNSVLLAIVMMILLLAIGASLGIALTGELQSGILIAFAVGVIVLLVAALSGASAILAFSGAHQIEKEDAPQLFNVVEELSLAAGIPMPKVYIIEEDAPNAFATGMSPDKAAVAITAGLLEKLNREQLQGVMAHEIGHIRNFDICFSLMLAILAGGIVMISEIFLRSLWLSGGRRRSNNRNEGGAQLIFLVIGIILAILAPILTALIQMAVSRQREYLADSSAVEFTRNPEGLAQALEILAGDRSPMKVSNATENMYIVNPNLGLRGGADSLFSTHPPIAKRIARLRGLTTD